MFGMSPTKKKDRMMEKAAGYIAANQYGAAYQILLKFSEAPLSTISYYREDEVKYMLDLCIFKIYGYGTDPTAPKKQEEKKPKTREEIALDWLSQGMDYEYGSKGHEKNIRRAYECYRNAAEFGSASGMYSVAVMLSESDEIPHNYEQAFEWMLKAAENGYKLAYGKVALMYNHGKGTQRNQENAIYWMEKAADSGDTLYVPDFASSYYRIKDYKTAYYWYSKAAENGHEDSQLIAAKLSLSEDDIPLDVYRAEKWLRAASMKDNSEAYSILSQLQSQLKEDGDASFWHDAGMKYMRSDDFEAATYAFKKAQEKNHPDATFTLMTVYSIPENPSHNYELAYEYAIKMSKDGYMEGCLTLSKLYANGYYVEKDTDTAIGWQLKAKHSKVYLDEMFPDNKQ